MAILKAEDFELELSFIGSKTDNLFVLTISVSCEAYSGKTTFNVPKEQYYGFVSNICDLYSNLSKEKAVISDFEPDKNNMCFELDGRGNFTISGVFNNFEGRTLKFIKSIDQTFFKRFVLQLTYELLGQAN